MIAVLFALLIVGPLQPDPELTPGVVRPLTRQQVCSTHWGLDVRHVSEAKRREVFRLYGIPWSKHRFYIVDHLDPRELGGDDVVANLWPQLRADAKRKDVDENRLHRAVCAGTVSLEDAQQQMRTWGR